MKYLIKTERLGIRNWVKDDIPKMAAISGNPIVMRYFPGIATYEQTEQYIIKSIQDFESRGYCYFAVERIDNGEFIGFIGLAYQDYEAPFCPNVDIGWRLDPSAQGMGFATEGAQACLKYGFQEIGLKEIYAVCPTVNHPSENVMKKIGMTKQGIFKHPRLKDWPEIEDCYYYRITDHEFLETM
ncbi:MAG: GNAT family N-acetyltransferase [Bacteroidota bacterium]